MGLVSSLYKLARVANDLNKIGMALSGRPAPLARRIANKWIGRNVVKHLWLRGSSRKPW